MGEGPASRAIIWVARIWSLAAVGFVLLFLVGEVLNGQGGKPTGAEWIGLAFWPGGVCLGLIIAWFRLGLGGAIATGSLVGFYIWYLLERGTFPRGAYFILVAAPGVLFLVASLLSNRSQQTRSA
jgi:hypothetical protein